MTQSDTPARGDETDVLAHLDTTAMSGLYWYLGRAGLYRRVPVRLRHRCHRVGPRLHPLQARRASGRVTWWPAHRWAPARGAGIAGPLTDHFGRKSLLITDAAIYAIGALLSAFTVNAAMLLVVPDADRARRGRRLGHRHGLHRGVRAPRAGEAS